MRDLEWPVQAASMGPSMIVDGKRKYARRKYARCIGFNGAVDDRRRKEADLFTNSAGTFSLQWGRR